jgi:NTE family protein
MSEPTAKLVEVGVVLQGGGALGAYECGALDALLELMDGYAAEGRNVALKVVAGVSIGALNAACVVGSKSRADARRRLDALWDDLTLEAPPFWPANAQRDLAYFGLPSFYMPRPDFWNLAHWTHVYDTRPLLGTLARHVDFDALNASPTAFVATAVEVMTGQVHLFSNKAVNGTPPLKIDPRHVLASGSLPPGFPWIAINGVQYWDGGIVDNTPLSVAIDAFSDDPDAARMLVVINLINALVETIEDLASKVPPDDVSDWLSARLEEARRYKIIDAIVNIDMQDPAVTLLPSEQNPADDRDGIRDFSVASVNRRRKDGYKFARAVLEPAFENRWHMPTRDEQAALAAAEM